MYLGHLIESSLLIKELIKRFFLSVFLPSSVGTATFSELLLNWPCQTVYGPPFKGVLRERGEGKVDGLFRPKQHLDLFLFSAPTQSALVLH